MKPGIAVCRAAVVGVLLFAACKSTTGPSEDKGGDGPLTLTYPVGGEKVHVGDTLRIQWDLDTTRTTITEVNLHASVDGKTWVLLNTEMAVNMEDPQWRNFPWPVPDTLEFPWFMDPRPDPIPLVNKQIRIKVAEYEGPLKDQSELISVAP